MLAYAEDSTTGSSTWTAAIEGDFDHGTVRLGKAERFQRTPFTELYPAFSPDGRWLAYSSNETGTFEVYVRPFLGPAANGRSPLAAV